jgi:hypothetical protein
MVIIKKKIYFGFSKVYVILFIMISSIGCSRFKGIGDYAYDRAKDLEDIFTLSGGLGVGAKARIGPINAGLFASHDFTGLRGGDLGLSWGIWDSHYNGDVEATLFGIESFEGPGNSQKRGKTFFTGSDPDNPYQFRPFFRYPDFKNENNLPNYPYYYFTQIEIAGGAVITLRLGVNIGEIADFITSIFLLDIMKDDVGLSNILEWKTKDGEILKRRTPYIPIIIKEIEKISYTVEWDCETDFSKSIFRFYEYKNGKWEEINYTKFPKSLSVQNVCTDLKDKEIALKMDPEDYWFRQSKTGRLWILLETGKQYYETRDDDSYLPSFFSEFKEKYIIKKGNPGIETAPNNDTPQKSDSIK